MEATIKTLEAEKKKMVTRLVTRWNGPYSEESAQKAAQLQRSIQYLDEAIACLNGAMRVSK